MNTRKKKGDTQMYTQTSKLILSAAMTAALAGCSMTEKNTPPPPKPAPVAAPAPAPKVEVKKPEPAPTYVVEDVNFDFDKATLKPEATATLDEVVKGLRQDPKVPYEVGGHTDSIGSKAYNQGLSERRAQSVYDYLVTNGIDSDRLTVRGYGEERPQSGNDTRSGRAQNRRVEIKPL